MGFKELLKEFFLKLLGYKKCEYCGEQCHKSKYKTYLAHEHELCRNCYDKLMVEIDHTQDNCHVCNKEYKTSLDRFKCKYCGFNHCNKHRVPEDHNCKGNLHNPFPLVAGDDPGTAENRRRLKNKD